MFGRKPRLPIDSIFQTDTNDDYITSDYVEQLKTRLETSHEIANKALDKARKKQKTQFDKKAKATQINIGDTVLVKILAYEGRHKIADKFEEEMYKVVAQPHADIPVYIVKTSDGKEKRLHRNHLLPIEVGVEVADKAEKVQPVPEPKVQPVPKPRKNLEKFSEYKQSEMEKSDKRLVDDRSKEDSESEVEYVVTYSRERKRPAGRVDDTRTDDRSSRVEDMRTDDRSGRVKDMGTDDSSIEAEVVRRVDRKGEAEISRREDSSQHRAVESTVEIAEVPMTQSAQAEMTDGEVAIDEDEEIEINENDDLGDEDDETQELPVMDAEGVRPTEPPRPPPPPPCAPPRRSIRVRKKPVWHDTYHVGQQVVEKDTLQDLLKE